ncbi:fatty acyl-AMP ligase [Streptomyces sp. enrichment culture]|uniref:fatty acyl-AMP ligase n=1 Tax=Streptomyces sp. enrichment culture TaxID=1795815 RepID=UPI003F563BF8
MSRFVGMLLDTAARSTRGLVTGEPGRPRRRTWGELHQDARRIAAVLTADGVAPGSAVCVLAAEPVLVAPTVQAVWLLGGSVTMLHQPTPRSDLGEWSRDTVRALETVGSATVLIGPSFAPVADALAERGIRHRMLDETVARAATVEDDDSAAPADPVAATDEDSTALLQLTSGSTGRPKAVRITHGNLCANLTAIADRGRLDPGDDVMVSWLPLFHDMGMVAFLALPMAMGLELVKVTPADFVADPLLWPRLLSEYRATVTGAPNFAYAMAGRRLGKVSDPGALDLSRLRIALNGAEPIDEAALDRFTAAGARFGMAPECVLAAYGLAEATLAVSAAAPYTGLSVETVDAELVETEGRAVPPRPDRAVRTFSRLGAPLPGLEVTVVDAAGAVLGERQVGQLRVRGTSVTSVSLTADGPAAVLDAEGWLETGDLGYLSDGEVVVCGRSKDVIIMAGRNIHPTDIERAAARVDGVRAGNVAAVRIDAAAGREGFAVALESSLAGDREAEELLGKEVATQVVDAVGVRPAAVHVLPPGALPKTPSGKLRRAAAGERIAAHGAAVGP